MTLARSKKPEKGTDSEFGRRDLGNLKIIFARFCSGGVSRQKVRKEYFQ